MYFFSIFAIVGFSSLRYNLFFYEVLRGTNVLRNSVTAECSDSSSGVNVIIELLYTSLHLVGRITGQLEGNVLIFCYLGEGNYNYKTSLFILIEG